MEEDYLGCNLLCSPSTFLNVRVRYSSPSSTISLLSNDGIVEEY